MSVLKKLDTPIFQAEDLPTIKPENYTLTVKGLVEEEKTFSLAEVKKFPASKVNCRLTSVSGWSVRAEWDGVTWADFMKYIKPDNRATHVVFKSIGDYTTTVPLKDLDNPRVLLSYGVGGEPLEEEYGGPLRVVIPNLWGYKSCKWLIEIKFTDKMEGGFWEERGYSDHGTIEPGETYDVNTKTRRPIKGGEVIDF